MCVSFETTADGVQWRGGWSDCWCWGPRRPSDRACTTRRSTRTAASTSSTTPRTPHGSSRAARWRVQSITRLGGGPNGETLVGDNERALQLYYFKHDISEPVPEPTPTPPPAPPPYKFSGLMFGDFYYFDEHHLPAFDSQNGLWFRRMYFTFDYTFSPKIMTRFRLETNSNGKLQGGADHAVRQGRLPALERLRTPTAHARDPALAFLRLHRGLLGAAAHREDAARPLPVGLFARHRHHLVGTDQPEADVQVRGPGRERVGQQRRDRQVQGIPRRCPLRAAGRGGRFHRGADGGRLPAAARRRPHHRADLRRVSWKDVGPRRRTVFVSGAQAR